VRQGGGQAPEDSVGLVVESDLVQDTGPIVVNGFARQHAVGGKPEDARSRGADVLPQCEAGPPISRRSIRALRVPYHGHRMRGNRGSARGESCADEK